MNKIIDQLSLCFQNLFNAVIPGSPVSPNEVTYYGSQSWVYYLFGAFFIIFAIVTLYFSFRFRNVKEFEHLYPSFGQFKIFWYKNRFGFMVVLTIVFFVAAIFFFLFNTYFLNK